MFQISITRLQASGLGSLNVSEVMIDKEALIHFSYRQSLEV